MENEIKICLCTLIKNDNLYINEFIEYYHSIGVNKIILGDNNDLNGEKIILDKKWLNSNYVEIHNIRGQWNVQPSWYNTKYHELLDKYNWFIFFDQDEFLELPKDIKTIQEFVSLDKFKDFNCISVIWKYYDDNNLVYYDPRPVRERFTHFQYIGGENGIDLKYISIKYILKSTPGIEITSNHNLLNHKNNIPILKNCDVFGFPLTKEFFEKQAIEYNIEYKTQVRFLNREEQKKHYEYCCLGHYQLKTVEEFIKYKIPAGLKHYNGKDMHRLTPFYFFKRNIVTDEKLLYFIKHYDEIKKCLEEMSKYCRKNTSLDDKDIFGPTYYRYKYLKYQINKN